MAERKRSIVWTHFTAVNANEATCDLCSKCIRYCGNTTNLTKHLKVNHRKEHNDMERRRVEEREREGVQGKPPTPTARMRQTSLLESLQRGRQYPGIVKIHPSAHHHRHIDVDKIHLHKPPFTIPECFCQFCIKTSYFIYLFIYLFR